MEYSWSENGVCRAQRMAPILFFPTKKTDTSIPIAKRACEKCPVRKPCLLIALIDHEASGIWGGTTEWERETMRRVLGPNLATSLTALTSD